MDVLVERCAGLDVHKDTVVACVRTPAPGRGRAQQVVTFGTTTRGLGIAGRRSTRLHLPHARS